MKIETYTTWANRNGLSCVYLGHPKSIGRRFLRLVHPLRRRDLLQRAGYRCLTGSMMDECSRLTDQRGVLLTPAAAVRKFLEDSPAEYAEAVYYRDPECYSDLMVWVK